jgi:hypothetical protein
VVELAVRDSAAAALEFAAVRIASNLVAARDSTPAISTTAEKARARKLMLN